MLLAAETENKETAVATPEQSDSIANEVQDNDESESNDEDSLEDALPEDEEFQDFVEDPTDAAEDEAEEEEDPSEEEEN